MPSRSAQHTHRSTWYKGRSLEWRAPFTETPDAYFAGLRDGLATATGKTRIFNAPTKPQDRRAYGRGWATAMANHAAPGRGRKLKREPARKPEPLDAWTLANDNRIRAALAAGKMGKVEMVFDASTYQPQRKEPDTMPKNAKTKPTPPRAIVPSVAVQKHIARQFAPRGVTGSLAAKSPIQYAPPVATIADDIAAKRSAAARKAHETRKANGWVHPRSNGQTRATAAPVEPIKRASLADLAQGIAPDAVKAAPKTAPSKPAKVAPNKAPAKKVVRPAKKTAPKKKPAKPAKKAAKAPARGGR